MKLIQMLIFAGAASVMPTALAEPVDTTPIAYRIALDSSVKPVADKGMNYPASAALRGQSGYCDVTFDIAASGQTANVDVVSCTSDAFRREAKRLVSGLHYDKAGSDIALRVRWTIETPKITTASLR